MRPTPQRFRSGYSILVGSSKTYEPDGDPSSPFSHIYIYCSGGRLLKTFQRLLCSYISHKEDNKYTMPPAVKMPLPVGKLGIVFKGSPPTVARLSDESPMIGKVKVGYICESLILADGTTFENLSTSELVATLNEFAEESGRKLKMKMGLPNSVEVTLPEGDIGATIATVKDRPVITKIGAESTLKAKLRIGLCVDKVTLDDGTVIVGHSTEEINEFLTDDTANPGRKLSLVAPTMGMSAKSLTLPKVKTVQLPSGSLGVAFKSKKYTTILSMKADSPMRGLFRVGMVVDSVIMDDGTEFRGLDAKDLGSALKHSVEAEGRTMLLKNPAAKNLPEFSTTKVMLPSMGTSTEIGVVFAGSPATIKEVAETSPLFGKARRGQLVLTTGWADGTEYDELEADELDEILMDSSGEEGRYLVLKNLPLTLPDVATVELPAGKIGVVLKGNPPLVTRINPTSPIVEKLMVGMVADTLTLEGGETMYEMDTPDFTGALSANSESEKRVVRFINPATMSLSIAGELAKPDELEVELPAGKLGVSFKGNAPCMVTAVSKTSPVRMDIPKGMAVDSLTVGKLVYIDMDAMELAGYLKANSDKEGRVLKLKNPEVEGVEFQKLPDSKEVALPSGMLGVVFKGSPPCPASFKEGSAVEEVFPTGMFVDMVTLEDGTVMTGLPTKELVAVLKDSKDEKERTISFKNPKTKEPSPAAVILPDEKKVELPSGKLGVSFKGKDKAVAARIHESSSVRNLIRVGMVVDTIEMPDGKTYSGLTAKEAARILADTMETEGRVMILKNPQTATMTARNIAIDETDGAVMAEGEDAGDDASEVTEISEVG
jgi:hypothetical protein